MQVQQEKRHSHGPLFTFLDNINRPNGASLAKTGSRCDKPIQNSRKMIQQPAKRMVVI